MQWMQRAWAIIYVGLPTSSHVTEWWIHTTANGCGWHGVGAVSTMAHSDFGPLWSFQVVPSLPWYLS